MKETIIILGLNFGGHDTSACLMKNGELLSACEEERYTKEKHTRDFPKNAINDCLKQANISINDVDEITLSYDPSLLKIENFQNIISTSRQNFEISDFNKGYQLLLLGSLINLGIKQNRIANSLGIIILLFLYKDKLNKASKIFSSIYLVLERESVL